MDSNKLRVSKELLDLDNDINDMMSKFERKPYKDGWPEDKWKEEIEKCPLFMQSTPDPNEELPPLLQGLQQLKYDENENTPEELAATYKNEGNLNYGKKMYEQAIINYKEGLKQNCSDDMKAILYNNCAAAHYSLQNYRSALEDNRKALSKNPSYSKARVRIAHCLFHLCRYHECIKECEKLMNENRKNSDITKLRIQALIKMEELKCKQRREMRRQHTVEQMQTKLINAIRERNINIGQSGKLKSISQLKPPSAVSPTELVFLNDNNVLVWSVRFAYPEYDVMETVKQFMETETFSHHLEHMFSESPGWDVNKNYTWSNVNLYYANKHGLHVKVAINNTLLETITKPDFIVLDGSPLFHCVIPGSKAEVDLLNYAVTNQ